jgi:hypothetical protein
VGYVAQHMRHIAQARASRHRSNVFRGLCLATQLP